jgi:hypothetical protein
MRLTRVQSRPNNKKIWIDLENSPHVPFFAPMAREFENRGYTVMFTARDCFQVCGLADLIGLDYRRVGRHYGKNKFLKAAGLVIRFLQLVKIALAEKPDFALSHGSRSQLLASFALRIPHAVLVDYEHTWRMPVVTAGWVIVPDVIPHDSVAHEGRAILRYPGIKEDVYVPQFRPDPGIYDLLKLDTRNILVTVRPPAIEAHYFNPESDALFRSAIEFLAGVENVRLILLPRSAKQEDLLRKTWPKLFADGNLMIPESVVDGLNLIWHSDLVISGGGTMNREAAALGVPVYSIFRGRVGAVDRYLSERGRLVFLESIHDLKTKIRLVKRDVTAAPALKGNGALTSIVDSVESLLKGKQ